MGMAAPNTAYSRSRASSIASVDTTSSTSQRNAALRGATLAFGRTPPFQRAPSSSHAFVGSDNGALLAATSAGSGAIARGRTPGPARSRSPLPMPVQGLSVGSAGGDTLKDNMSSDMNERPAMKDRSASHQAAYLAASRAKPSAAAASDGHQARSRPGTAHRPAVMPKPRRLSEHYGRASVDEEQQEEKPTDTTSIAPTTSLVDLFEQKLKAVSRSPAGNRPEPIVIKPSSDLPLRSPKPVRSGITSMIQLELEQRNNKESGRPGPAMQNIPAPMSSHDDGHSSDDSFASASEDLNERSSPSCFSKSGPSPSPGDTLRSQNEARRKPRPAAESPLHQLTSRPIPIGQRRRASSAHSDAMSMGSAPSLMSIPAQFNQAHPRRTTPLRTGDDLANALVASSLASSRAPSPTKLEPPPIPSRKKKKGLRHHGLSLSRTPSPAKVGMLQTLRQQDDSSDSDSDDEKHPYRKHHKKRLVRKHPNKHHEGDRKRWRDAVTERERKRYEGVWAANKGLHYSFTYEEQDFFKQQPNHRQTLALKAAVNDQVSNVIVREIWSRSRLPEYALETVWDLVDHDSVGRLTKEEFVVGMWLIDQRLKGRKLPVRVSESVWASVRGIQGIKIRKS